MKCIFVLSCHPQVVGTLYHVGGLGRGEAGHAFAQEGLALEQGGEDFRAGAVLVHGHAHVFCGLCHTGAGDVYLLVGLHE